MVAKLFRRAALFLALGLVPLGALYLVSESVSPVYADQKLRVRFLEESADSLEALAVGNSHNLAIDFDALGMRGFHIWQGGTDPFELEYQLRYLMPRVPRVRTVLIPASYFLFVSDNAALVTEDRSDLRRSFYAAQPQPRWIAGDFTHFLEAHAAPVARPDHWLGVVKGLATGQRVGVPTERSYCRPVLLTADSLAKDAAKRLELHRGLYTEMSQNHPRLADDAQAALARAVDGLRERGVRVVFFTPPYYHLYERGFDPRVRDDMRRRMAALASRPGVEWHDLSQDPALTRDPANFMDGDHLSCRGAAAFSRRLRAEMK
ncbi:MAG TPA: hypothetical protein VF263_18480 [Longimicrobiaceae bacterium]